MVPPLSRRALVQALAVAAAARPPVSAPASLTGSAGRVVAVGDIHGDLHALVKLLELSGLWSEAKRKWTGGTATFVQLGDTLDRGDDEYEVLELLRELKAAATVGGGRVITMLGNHEVMNVMGVATPFISPQSKGFGDDRAAAFRPGGEFAREFASWPVVAVVGTTAFVHAGLTPAIARDAEAINAAAASWLRAERDIPSILLPGLGQRSPVWTRYLSNPPDVDVSSNSCAELREALALLGAKRVVVGHTPQDRINCACGCIWRIDLGMSAAMGGGRLEAIEIVGDEVNVLTLDGESVPGSKRGSLTPYRAADPLDSL